MNEKLHKKVSPPFEGGEKYQTYIQYFTFCLKHKGVSSWELWTDSIISIKNGVLTHSNTSEPDEVLNINFLLLRV